jgi:Flp pilus assembly protein TadD
LRTADAVVEGAKVVATRVLLGVLLGLGTGVSGYDARAASDTSSVAPPDRQWMKTSADLIRDGKVSDALARLREVNQPDSADWHNLMGYAFRKQTPPDLERSEFHYASALRIKADHRGALEYYGELLLMKNDLAGAEGMLQRLSKACFFGCGEHRDLKEAIERYRKGK